MEDAKIKRSYLETLSFSDLVKLADKYGVDVPEDLDRRFLIGEILELAEESVHEEEDTMIISSGAESCHNTSLPKSYNETQISCVLRNPVWAFVFWDVSETDLAMLRQISDFTVALRVCLLESDKDLNPKEAFEIEIPKGVNEQYVYLPAKCGYVRVELVYSSGSNREVLAFSSVIEVPKNSDQLQDFQPGMQKDFPDIIKLSGIETLLMEQYTNYGHSFS